MYAAYNKSKLIDASVEYVTMNGNLLSKVGLVTTGAVLALSDNSSNAGDSSTRSTPVETPVPTPPPTRSEMTVWIPTNGGTKYHSKSSCSSMKNPIQVTVSEAIAMGFGQCGRCW